MQLDHVSYAVLPSELASTVQRLGAALGAPFASGGNHPRFGTCNFILPLAGGTYVEIVAPLEHPAASQAPFGAAVRQRAESGGGWMGWVVQVDDISAIESRLGRDSVQGHRVRPDGVDVTWRQIGVNDLIADPQLPYFISWDDMAMHPSTGGGSELEIASIAISGEKDKVVNWLGECGADFVERVDLVWVEDDEPGLSAVTFRTPGGAVTID